jgi:methylglutamate dehydrogenase subunit C
MRVTPSQWRLSRGGRIDRSAPLNFSFDGKPLSGFRGDTLASALIANGVRLVGRSFKYHRRRGIVTAGSDEPNALVELHSGARREPNTKLTTVELFEGLEARSQNRWPSLSFDVGAINGLFGRLLVAGFYYKTFMWPASFWEKLYEPAIRRAAGLGRAATEPDPDAYEKCHAFCDVLVVGSGPSGLMAALTLARAGVRVILCEEDFDFGGRLLSDRLEMDARPAYEWLANVVAELRSLPSVRVMNRMTVFGAYDHGVYGAIERCTDHLDTVQSAQVRQRYWKIMARCAIVATGATERLIAFGGNDLPGVMAASAVRTYVNRYAALPGQRTAVFTNNDSGWAAAADLEEAGVEVAALIDSRNLPARPAQTRCRVVMGGQIVAVNGLHSARSIDVLTVSGTERIDVDSLAVSGGWNPNVAIATQLGARSQWRDGAAAFVCAAPPAGVKIVGAANARWTLAQCLIDGQHAARELLATLGVRAQQVPIPSSSVEHSSGELLWRVRESRGKSFVDFQHDVTVQDLELAVREGFGNAEHAKRYTTLGMGTDQGRGSGVIGQAILADISNQPLSQFGTISLRPPYTPVAIGAVAARNRGQAFRSTRLTPTHDWALARGATFGNTGLWKCAQYFSRPGDENAAATVHREVLAARQSVGICDLSSLGKIEIRGEHALEFLECVYANPISTLAVGASCHGILLREDGHVLDENLIVRLGTAHFTLFTSTASAELVLQHIEYCRYVLWPRLDVQIIDVTDGWAHLSIAGMRSRELLQRVLDPTSRTVFEQLSASGIASVAVQGVEARLYQASSHGEIAYELGMPARYGEAVMSRLIHMGEDLGAVSYGMAALDVMRVERGDLSSNEMSGQTTARDLGRGAALASDKDYIGSVLARRVGLNGPERLTLVGLIAVDSAAQLNAGAHLVLSAKRAATRESQGYVTSVARSPSAGRWIGLGFLTHASQRIGEIVQACDPLRGTEIAVKVCLPLFIGSEPSYARG